MKFFAALALVGAISAKHHYPVNFVELSESSSSSTSASDEENVAIGDFIPGQGAGYERVIPGRFLDHSDVYGQVDIFQRSMLENYATEGQKDKEDGGGPTGVFFLTKSQAKAAARETLATNKGLKGEALTKYLDTYFDKAWGHFDVNQVGSIASLRMAEFIRFLASDQYMSIG